ncbi:hypothetical protein Hypma_007534 [Hypsizygus marmoreus]|uniref:Uncharacterized protein n=1 Tax=Hypsizygus marmoreus TaxID=39966 RepID=A0A369JXL4_HYPMA|nr:hypothetical protein Hypma_007534 [Hypsizygus marmoreus]
MAAHGDDPHTALRRQRPPELTVRWWDSKSLDRIVSALKPQRSTGHLLTLPNTVIERWAHGVWRHTSPLEPTQGSQIDSQALFTTCQIPTSLTFYLPGFCKVYLAVTNHPKMSTATITLVAGVSPFRSPPWKII